MLRLALSDVVGCSQCTDLRRRGRQRTPHARRSRLPACRQPGKLTRRTHVAIVNTSPQWLQRSVAATIAPCIQYAQSLLRQRKFEPGTSYNPRDIVSSHINIHDVCDHNRRHYNTQSAQVLLQRSRAIVSATIAATYLLYSCDHSQGDSSALFVFIVKL